MFKIETSWDLEEREREREKKEGLKLALHAERKQIYQRGTLYEGGTGILRRYLSQLYDFNYSKLPMTYPRT